MSPKNTKLTYEGKNEQIKQYVHESEFESAGLDM